MVLRLPSPDRHGIDALAGPRLGDAVVIALIAATTVIQLSLFRP